MLEVPAISPQDFHLRETVMHENKDIFTRLFIIV